MKILAVDSSAVSASAAIVEDGKVLGEFYLNTSLTHSQTLMPMVENVLECTRIPLSDIDLFAVSSGPGSFTGIRIGVASVKGLAMAQKKPCVGVSTLEAMAYNAAHLDGIIAGAMDARRAQVYNALFRAKNGILERLTEDRAIAIDALAEECQIYGKTVYLVGDGAKLCYNSTGFRESNAVLLPEPLIYQRACNVAKAAERLAEQGKTVTAAQLAPVYLRPAQAERELKKRQKGESL